jgi:hypothetical protein
MKLPGAILFSLESDAGGEWRHCSTFTYPRHLTEVRCHFTPRPQYPWKQHPQLLKTMIVGPKQSWGRSAVHVNLNTIRRSASAYPTPAAGVNKLTAIQTIPLVQAGSRARPCGICGRHSNNQRGVSLRTYFFFPAVSFHQVSVRVFHSSTYATITYNFGSSEGH